MENDPVHYKAVLQSKALFQIRRFTVERHVSTNLKYLKEKLTMIFPSLYGSVFDVYYDDSDSDRVCISSDDELVIALTEMTGPTYKIHISRSETPFQSVQWDYSYGYYGYPPQQQQQQQQQQQRYTDLDKENSPADKPSMPVTGTSDKVQGAPDEDPDLDKESSPADKDVIDDEAKTAFRELLKETKKITDKSLALVRDKSGHLEEIQEQLEKDRRYLDLECLESERREILMSFLEETEKRGPPPSMLQGYKND